MHKTAGSVATVVLAAAFIFVSPLGAQAAAATLDLGSYDWSVSAKPNLTTKPPPEQAVQAFLTKLYANDPRLVSFAFADLRQSGTLSLVASTAGGTRGVGQTLIVDKVGKKFESAWINCGDDLIKIGGKPVIVGCTQISAYNGASSCTAFFPVIYGWNGSTYVDMSRQFPEFYRNTLHDLQHKIASSPTSADYAQRPVRCDEITADAIERYLGISPDAGIEDAIRWSQSSKQIDRMMAIGVFAAIGTPRAFDYLKAMTEDSDPRVARAAEGNLNALDSRGSAEDPIEKVGHLTVYTGPP